MKTNWVNGMTKYPVNCLKRKQIERRRRFRSGRSYETWFFNSVQTRSHQTSRTVEQTTKWFCSFILDDRHSYDSSDLCTKDWTERWIIIQHHHRPFKVNSIEVNETDRNTANDRIEKKNQFLSLRIAFNLLCLCNRCERIRHSIRLFIYNLLLFLFDKVIVISFASMHFLFKFGFVVSLDLACSLLAAESMLHSFEMEFIRWFRDSARSCANVVIVRMVQSRTLPCVRIANQKLLVE